MINVQFVALEPRNFEKLAKALDVSIESLEFLHREDFELNQVRGFWINDV